MQTERLLCHLISSGFCPLTPSTAGDSDDQRRTDGDAGCSWVSAAGDREDEDAVDEDGDGSRCRLDLDRNLHRFLRLRSQMTFLRRLTFQERS